MAETKGYERTKRKLPTLRAIFNKSVTMLCRSPDVCGDGWNPWDCAPCMASARRRHDVNHGKYPARGE